MNRMNYGAGCCMPSANGRQMPRKKADAPECRTQTACSSDTGWRNEEIPRDLPVGDRKALLNLIYEEGFASCEAVLYLDTHPDDPDARAYFRLHNRRYQAAVREYGRLYAPLTIDTASSSPTEAWNWMQQPWPWEGGAC